MALAHATRTKRLGTSERSNYQLDVRRYRGVALPEPYGREQRRLLDGEVLALAQAVHQRA